MLPEIARALWSDTLIVEVPVESIEQAELDLLRLGPEVEVLKPRELRRRLAIAARAMAKLNPSR
jgi:hypothetical protein